MARADSVRDSGLGGPHRRRSYPSATTPAESVGGDPDATATGAGPDPQRRTVAEILKDVEGDPEAARKALAAENLSDRPRSTLVAALTDVIGGTSTDGPPDASGEE